MRKIKLVTTAQNIIYEGHHTTLTDAIHFAIENNISLDGIDLSFENLHHINLDGVSITGGNFTEADLTGANMSEACFTDCIFDGATLTDACLCYTDIKGCNFKYAKFPASDFSMARLDFCTFQGWDALQIDWKSAFELGNLTYIHHTTACPFSVPPTLVSTGERNIAILDKHMISKDVPHTFEHNIPTKSIAITAYKSLQFMIDFEIKKYKN